MRKSAQVAAPVKKAAPPPPSKKSTLPAIVTAPKRALAAAPDGYDELIPFAATGLEAVTAADLMIPRLTILQSLSPQLSKSQPEFVEGAEAGDFCDCGTGDVFKETVEIVPVFFARVFLEWAPRASGKGLVKNHGLDASILERCDRDDKGRHLLKGGAGNYIAETAQYFCLNLSSGRRRSFIPLASTQLRASRRWMTLLTAEKIAGSNGREFTPPIFYRSWVASVRETSNNEGSWFMWHFEPGDPILSIDPQRGLLEEAKGFYEAAKKNLVTGDVAGIRADEPGEGAI